MAFLPPSHLPDPGIGSVSLASEPLEKNPEAIKVQNNTGKAKTKRKRGRKRERKVRNNQERKEGRNREEGRNKG